MDPVDVLWHRHAQFSLGEYSAAIEAYEAGLKLDPANQVMKGALATCKTRLAETGGASGDTGGDLRSAAEPGMGAGRGAGAGGMPDLSALASMFGGGAGGGGGMPDLASMMQNPQMMAMRVAHHTLGSWADVSPTIIGHSR